MISTRPEALDVLRRSCAPSGAAGCVARREQGGVRQMGEALAAHVVIWDNLQHRLDDHGPPDVGQKRPIVAGCHG